MGPVSLCVSQVDNYGFVSTFNKPYYRQQYQQIVNIHWSWGLTGDMPLMGTKQMPHLTIKVPMNHPLLLPPRLPFSLVHAVPTNHSWSLYFHTPEHRACPTKALLQFHAWTIKITYQYLDIKK